MVPLGNVPDSEKKAGGRQLAHDKREHESRACAAPGCLRRTTTGDRLCPECRALIRTSSNE